MSEPPKMQLKEWKDKGGREYRQHISDKEPISRVNSHSRMRKRRDKWLEKTPPPENPNG